MRAAGRAGGRGRGGGAVEGRGNKRNEEKT